MERAETCASSVPPLKAAVENISTRVETTISSLAALHDSQDDLDNRSRRNNLILYGLLDAVNESWAESEEKVVSFFSDKLDISVTPTSIERAHRLGKYQVESTRPLIVKFLSFKDKRVLAAASKLREIFL